MSFKLKLHPFAFFPFLKLELTSMIYLFLITKYLFVKSHPNFVILICVVDMNSSPLFSYLFKHKLLQKSVYLCLYISSTGMWEPEGR